MRRDPARVAGIGGVDRLIHEPARLELMANLAVVAEADFVHLVHATGLSAGNAGAHLKRLADAGYVAFEKSFVDGRPQTVYAITDAGRAALRSYASAMAAVLDALPD